MNRTVTRIAACALAFAFAAGAIAAPAQAKVKPKTGAYYKMMGKQTAYITTDKGKVTGVAGTIAFKKAGKACVPEGLYESDGVSGVYFTPKHPVAPNRSNRFSFKGAKQASYPKLKTSISGRFLSASKATFTIVAYQGKCKARLTVKNAKFTAGG